MKVNVEDLRNVMRGSEKLCVLGGFIQDQIELEIAGLYSGEVTQAVEKYCKNEPELWHVADIIEETLENYDEKLYRCKLIDGEELGYDEYDERNYHDDKEDDYRENRFKEFKEWLADQTARLEYEKCKNNQQMPWAKWDLKVGTRRALQKLNALEERIAFLMNSTREDEITSAKKIAGLPEFQCDVKYIVCVRDFVYEQLAESHNGKEEFEQACKEHFAEDACKQQI